MYNVVEGKTDACRNWTRKHQCLGQMAFILLPKDIGYKATYYIKH